MIMPDQQWLGAALEEYKSLRTESLTAMANQQATLRFGTTALGVTLGLAVNAQAEARFWAFSLLVPIFALVFYALYAIEFGRMVRVGRYIDAVETKINLMFSNLPSPLGWEKWLDTPGPRSKKPRLPYYLAVPIMFFAATTFSTVMAYVFRKDGPFYPQWNTLMLVLVWLLVMTVIFQISSTLKNLREYYNKFSDGGENG
jgi:hypothetical protein